MPALATDPARPDPAFWRDRRVLVTGHTGFKGAWLSLWLSELGAAVTGFADTVPTTPSLFELARVGELVDDLRGDVRDPRAVADALAHARPEIVLHLAAQPFVRRSYRDPAGTYATNVQGTVNVLEAAGGDPDVRAMVVVTTDKCYAPRDGGRPYREDDPLGGHDPYSTSKAAAELVATGYRATFAARGDGGAPRVATARAGNVIGGGDWGEDRLVPDAVRAVAAGTVLRVRNPAAVRPWQHVLNPLSGYLRLAERVWEAPEAARAWNFGPDHGDARPVGALLERLAALWAGALRWEADPGSHPPEAGWLELDSSLARAELGWAPRWGLERGLAETVAWHRAHLDGADLRDVTLAQLRAY